MDFNLVQYAMEIMDFLCTETLEDIDLGVLDLTFVRNPELRQVLCFIEEVLALELKVNYLENATGIFRVHVNSNGYYYKEFGYVIEADSLGELKEMVLSENRIWYVFDEELAGKLKSIGDCQAQKVPVR